MEWRKKLEAFSRRLSARYRFIIAGLLVVTWLFSIVAFKDAEVIFPLVVALVLLLGIIPMKKSRRRRSS